MRRYSHEPVVRFGLLCAALCFPAVGCQPSGPVRHPVTGLVKVDGQPAERVVVQFESEVLRLDSNDRYPVAITNAEGKFVLGDKSAVAGAVEGKYRVMFSWLSSPNLDATDKLRGKYADGAKSKFAVIVPLAEELIFELSSK